MREQVRAARGVSRLMPTEVLRENVSLRPGFPSPSSSPPHTLPLASCWGSHAWPHRVGFLDLSLPRRATLHSPG